ncbi:MAG: SH3 domain-containing protein [Cohaesibacter sp.]|nr:SH3 domain-containing protein [Cohaesibacter sp.]
MSKFRRLHMRLLTPSLCAMVASLPLAITAMPLISSQAHAASAEAISALNVRTGPGRKYQKIATLGRGELVHVRHCRKNGWCKINFRRQVGWVSGRYLDGSEPYIAEIAPRHDETIIIETQPQVIIKEAPEIVVIEPDEPDIIIDEAPDFIIEGAPDIAIEEGYDDDDDDVIVIIED